MPRPALELAQQFSRRLAALERRRRRLEVLAATRALAKRDIENVYEALYLRTIIEFEEYLEEVFFCFVTGRISSRKYGVQCRIRVRSERIGREIVLAGDDYLTWLPYDRTEKRAKIYLKDGLPFTVVDGNDKGFLKQALLVRNAIAHRSDFATRQFRDKVNGVSVLPPRDRTPAGFLRSRFRIRPSQCHYEDFAAELSRIALKICQ